MNLDLATASDPDGDNVTADTTPTFTGRAEADATVKIYVDGVHKGSARAGSDGSYSVETSWLHYGKQEITATATDAAGNTSAASGALSITISKRAG